VWNSEDHVWNEYWSDALGHWVHLDSCEGSWNQPLLYELGWGKKQAYCIAVGRHGVEDVTRCYADDWMSCWERRRRFDEQDLARVSKIRLVVWKEGRLPIQFPFQVLQSTTANMRSILSSEQRQRLATNDHSQAQWASDGRLRRLAAQADDSARQGRQSGTADWRAVRKELRLDTNQQSHRTLKREILLVFTPAYAR
jgi:peptide-N4-(N-acetyl-beta-glucosaminyl)asparagine amidase